MNNKTWITGYRPAGVPYVEQFKNLLLSRTKNCNKMLELLHLQLIRKGLAGGNFYRFYHPTLKQNLYFNSHYWIKSPDPSPYNYHSGTALGLNQYFVGQSPYKHYQGNLKDGIYHDKCEILAGKYMDKFKNFANLSVNGYITYRYRDDDGEQTGYSFAPWYLVDNSGNMVFMSAPKSFIENRKFSLIYKVTRSRAEGVRFSESTIRFDWTYYTKVYEQIMVNGRQVIRDTGETSSFTIQRYKGRIDPYYEQNAYEHMQQDYISAHMSVNQIYSYGRLKTGLGSDHTKYVKYWNHADVVTSGGYDLQVSFTDANSSLSYTLYPVGISGEYIIFNDGRLGKFITKNLLGEDTLRISLTETFYSSNNMPVRGSFRWYKEWASHYYLYVNEDKGVPGWVFPIAAIVILIASIWTGGAAAASAGAAMGAASGAAVNAVVMLTYASFMFMGLGLIATASAMLGGGKGALRAGKIFGGISSILGIASAITSVWNSFSSQLASNASRLSASATASNSGLSQTASLYTTTGSANASAVGSNLATSSTLPGGFSMVSSNSGTFIISSSGLATNVSTGATMAITGSNSIFSGMSSVNVFTSNITISSLSGGNMLYSPVTANALMPSVFTGSGISNNQFSNILSKFQDLYKAYGDTRDIFKSPNRYADDEMPDNDDEPKINFIPMNTELIKRKNYSISEDYDLGLEKGTLMYLPSVREKIKLIERTQNG
ncbi:Uncharacterised protein [Campylobacter hyointestinalis]|uniref:hypothetical protein n=1 Tax=Campylobacter hyointestinalis TaxID=198 RepID=UPI000723919F|nr:hypothetical protein [Campylobacter hyointestinalis]CUU89117.1 Uncharacterised protein [Campylobacter hyointestinalis]